MLLTSAADENELETWRSKFGRCQLPPAKMRPQPQIADALIKLPGVLALMLRMRLKALGFPGAFSISHGRRSRRDIGGDRDGYAPDDGGVA